jgi:hypothetical protein
MVRLINPLLCDSVPDCGLTDQIVENTIDLDPEYQRGM